MKQILLFLFLCLLVACNADSQPTTTPVTTETATSTPEMASVMSNEIETPAITNTPRPTRVPATVTINPAFFTLNICLSGERPSHSYGRLTESGTQLDLFYLLQEPLHQLADYTFQPRGLTDSRVTFENISVEEGELVVDVQGSVTPLAPNLTLYNAEGIPFSYTGGAVELPQMVVVSRLEPLVWSDGVPVTAFDSEFAYQVDAHPDVPSDKTRVNRTASYTALNADTVQWVGLPGWREPLYWQNVWQPMPRHRLGQYAPATLFSLPEVTETPLSTGPYLIKRQDADSISLEYNPYYYRLSTENVPRIPFIEVRFLPDANQRVAQFLSGQCDFIIFDEAEGLTQLSFMIEADSNGLGLTFTRPSSQIEQLVFGNEDWFGDVRVRQAVAHCLDRGNMAEIITQGELSPINSYVHDEHPLAPELTIEYAPITGRTLLDEAGWLDNDGDGVREDGNERPFAITLLTTNPNQGEMLTKISQDLLACGISAEPLLVESLPESYDMALVSQATGFVPPCQEYIGALGLGAEFEQACLQGNGAVWGSTAFEASHREALRLWGESVTAVSLYAVPDLAASSMTVLEAGYNTSEPSPLWNVAEWELLAR